MSVSEFKTSAWQAAERAEAYHKSTVAAPRLYQLLRHELFLRYVQRYAEAGAKILDLGSGTGLLSAPLHDLGYDVVGCDASQAMLNRASENCAQRNIEWRLGSGFNVPAKDGEFDMVLSRMFIAHFPDWPLVLREKARVTRPGGIVFFDFGNLEHLLTSDQNPERNVGFPYRNDVNFPEHFYAVASEEQMGKAADECGLDVVTIIPHGLLLYNLHFWQSAGSKGVDEFNAKIEQLLQDEKARELVLFLEESFMPHLPHDTTYGSLVVLRRRS